LIDQIQQVVTPLQRHTVYYSTYHRMTLAIIVDEVDFVIRHDVIYG